MARIRKQAASVTAAITPVNSAIPTLTPLTFGSFLPTRFQPIQEEKELSEDEEGNNNQWNNTNVVIEKEAQKYPDLIATAEAGKEKVMHTKELRQLNSNSQMGMRLEYVPPSHRDGKVVIQIEEEDVSKLNEYWGTALIGYALGDTPYEKSMENYVESVWDFVTRPQILYHQEGYYVFRFTTVEERDEVVQAGPYSYHNKPFILQNWERDFHFDPKCITTIPLWIHLPSLSAEYWTADALSKVASVVGLPMYTDKFTAELNKISYAGVLVKVDITKPLVKNFEIATPTGTRQQEILYEWRPKFCVECLHFGHDSFECWKSIKHHKDTEFKAPKRRNRGRRRKVIQEWKPKDQQEQEEGIEEVIEVQPPIDKGKQNIADKPDQRSMMIQRKDSSERQNTPVVQQDINGEASTSNRFTVLEECGQVSVHGGVNNSDPIQKPP
ncbi:PREDICTED: uncharacterized protein LOC109222056 [Nicotiana attenuata]|uniref:DUF4283 domain-containing protein n=1 Tax=Nicotiana attenuata TaxID=49451 RepID=A0A1J6JMH0_NICAT|nr:PREDICTED: uncharacterized protein LOC109222056 [Nicotiana attenuata]OIT18954.1 hypothetical protein A4A49_42970 [Nicotiana attenuata]